MDDISHNYEKKSDSVYIETLKPECNQLQAMCLLIIGIKIVL